MFDKIVNRVRSYFGKVTQTEQAFNGGPAIRNISPSLGQLYRERAKLVHDSKPFEWVEPQTLTNEHGVVFTLPGFATMHNRVGTTLNMGRNRFKRACKAAGINRVRAERAILAGASFEDAARA